MLLACGRSKELLAELACPHAPSVLLEREQPGSARAALMLKGICRKTKEELRPEKMAFLTPRRKGAAILAARIAALSAQLLVHSELPVLRGANCSSGDNLQKLLHFPADVYEEETTSFLNSASYG